MSAGARRVMMLTKAELGTEISHLAPKRYYELARTFVPIG